MSGPVKLPLADTQGRPLRDLRISVTDRCNFRCGYCMPREVYGPGFTFLPKPKILTFEEIHRVAQVLVGLGVTKLRLTGGEPLLRSQLTRLVEMLAPLTPDLAMTTNGVLLSRHAQGLADAGLRRVTVSLDALNDAVFKRMSDTEHEVKDVLEGMKAATAAGMSIKVNCVVRRGQNDDQIVPLARYFRGTGIILRFIEFMDVGLTNGWRLDQVVSGREIVERIAAHFALRAKPANYRGEVATRYEYADGAGEVGVITSVTQPFCKNCSRARLSADGHLFTCLFSSAGHDIKPVLRTSPDPNALQALIAELWERRDDAYSQRRSQNTRNLPRPEMSFIGG